MRLPSRGTISVAIASLALFAGMGASTARAQGYSSDSWATYPQYNPWGGYAPANAWGGYAPPTATPPPGTAWGGYAPARTWGGYTVTPGYTVPAGTVPTMRYVYAPVQTRRAAATPSWRTSPSTYREFGTGRNVFMHKPWLPNQ